MRFQSLVAAALLGLPLAAQPPAAKPAQIERGRYLVEEVAQCQMCHTPKGEDGKLDRTRWMKGAVLEVAPINPIQGWHKTAPDITPGGNVWRKWADQGMLNYMKTGKTPRGTPADPPMPAYKLAAEDAEAVVAYLKTLVE
jgi:mono/diheme cytochrome c family protein